MNQKEIFKSYPKPPKKEKKTPQQMWNDIKKRAFEKQRKKNAPLNEKDERFQKMLWSERDKVCAECDCQLPLEYDKKLVNHILEKSRYPSLRWDEANINFYCLMHHRNFHDNPSEKMKQVIADTKKYFGVE